jgi:hypothetical protein
MWSGVRLGGLLIFIGTPILDRMVPWGGCLGQVEERKVQPDLDKEKPHFARLRFQAAAHLGEGRCLQLADAFLGQAKLFAK